METSVSDSSKSGKSRQVLVRTLDVLGLKKSAKRTVKICSQTWNLAKGAAIYLLTAETPPQAYQSMINLFCATQGVSNDVLSWLVSRCRPPTALPNANGILGNFKPADLKKIARTLDERGYFVFENRLSDEICDKLFQFSLKTKSIARIMDSEDCSKYRETPVLFDRSNPSAVRYDYLIEDLVQDPTVQSILGDLSILSVAQAYLRASPVYDLVLMWWHTAFQKGPDAQAAQMFHFDMERLRWLKFFFYITDVGPENGPHVFVPGSHRTGAIPKTLLSDGYVRRTDAEVTELFGADGIMEFRGRRGTIIAEDTRGLHKGKHVHSGDRLVFQLQLANCFFGNPYPRVVIEQIKNEDFGKALALNPRIYSRFRFRP